MLPKKPNSGEDTTWCLGIHFASPRYVGGGGAACRRCWSRRSSCTNHRSVLRLWTNQRRVLWDDQSQLTCPCPPPPSRAAWSWSSWSSCVRAAARSSSAAPGPCPDIWPSQNIFRPIQNIFYPSLNITKKSLTWVWSPRRRCRGPWAACSQEARWCRGRGCSVRRKTRWPVVKKNDFFWWFWGKTRNFEVSAHTKLTKDWCFF